MKKISTITLLVFVISIFTLFANTTLYVPYHIPVINSLEPVSVVELEIEIEKIDLDIEIKDHKAFLNAMGMRESTNNYLAVNKFGYLGKYQFGVSTLKSLNIKTTKEEFLNNPELQEYAMQELLLDNKKRLKKYIKNYEGKTVHGVYITESGILAAAHLGGVGNVRKFFRKGYEFKDGYGTTMTSYMVKFSGYNLDIL
jgi:hypothetical protein|tara:strand:+ start:976 stop:1569 length:594 start_codon:yes stop_codon:yes gene_type:complete